MTTVDDTLLMTMLRQIRQDLAEQRTLLLQLADHSHRMERRLETKLTAIETRMGDLRDDLELMIKAETMGRLARYETLIDQRIDELAERIETTAPRTD